MYNYVILLLISAEFFLYKPYVFTQLSNIYHVLFVPQFRNFLMDILILHHLFVNDI